MGRTMSGQEAFDVVAKMFFDAGVPVEDVPGPDALVKVGGIILAERAHSARLAERVAELEQMYAEMKDAADKGSKSVFALAASQAENVRLREALYPLVVVALDADAREDAPEYVDGEPYNGMRALPECAACGGTGATDRNHYEDMPIPEEVFCGQCGGRGFLKHPVPATPCPTAALREVCEKVADNPWFRFGCSVWKNIAGDFDSGSAWELWEVAETCGLAERVKFDPAIHSSEDAEPGDEIMWPIKGDPKSAVEVVSSILGPEVKP